MENGANAAMGVRKALSNQAARRSAPSCDHIQYFDNFSELSDWILRIRLLKWLWAHQLQYERLPPLRQEQIHNALWGNGMDRMENLALHAVSSAVIQTEDETMHINGRQERRFVYGRRGIPLEICFRWESAWQESNYEEDTFHDGTFYTPLHSRTHLLLLYLEDKLAHQHLWANFVWWWLHRYERKHIADFDALLFTEKQKLVIVDRYSVRFKYPPRFIRSNETPHAILKTPDGARRELSLCVGDNQLEELKALVSGIEARP